MVTKRYLKELQYTLRKDDDGDFHLVMSGPEDLLEHGYLAIVSPEPPPHYKKDRTLRKRLSRPVKVRLSKKMVYEMQLDIQLTDRVFQNVVFELLASHCLNTRYVTERPIEISLLNDITTNGIVRERDQIIRDHLTCLVPFIQDASASSILKLRKAEQEAFLRFRQALNRAVDASLVSAKFTSADAQQVYQDILRPELSKLDARIKVSRAALLRDTSIKIGAWTAAIGIGLYTGIVPSELVLAAKALGLTKIVADLSEGILKNSRPDSEIKGADMYFLWKVRQSINH